MALVEVNDAGGEIVKVPGYGLLTACGLSVPANGQVGFARGCVFTKLGVASGDSVYVNMGSTTSCQFEAIPMLSLYLNQPNGIAGLDSNGNVNVGNVIPIFGTAAEIDVVLLAEGAIAIVDGVSIRIGDGVTLGGNPLEIEA